MGLLDRLKRLLKPEEAADRGPPTVAGSTLPMSTRPMSTMPAYTAGKVPTADVPAHLQLLEELGRGAMAVVHRAIDTRTGQEVALKRLLLASEVAPEDLADTRARFMREAQAAQALAHPDILRVLELGVGSDGDAWIVMELVRGHDLSVHVQPGHLLPVGQAMRVCVRLARALNHAHEHGIVHRDVKPANIRIDPATDTVKIMDFGIARVADGSRTRTGLVLGTPSYMAPEQLAGQSVDGRSDLYSLGVVLYQLLTGRLPHQSDSMARLMYEIANERVADVRDLRPGLPEALAMVLSLALEKRPDRRYASGEDLAQDLEAVLDQIDPLDLITSKPPAQPPSAGGFDQTQRIDTRRPS
jgi:serine/threonine-protein kinase